MQVGRQTWQVLALGLVIVVPAAGAAISTMPGLSVCVECGETNIPVNGRVSARIIITNAGPCTVEFSGAGFSSLLYQGSDSEENVQGFRAGEQEWRGTREHLVLAPGATHVQTFSCDLGKPYLPSVELVEGPAVLQATLHLILDGQKADLACREVRLQLQPPEIFRLKDIPAEFIFEKKGEVSRNETLPVTLKVANRTDQLVRFAVIGTASTPVSLRVTRTNPPSGDSRFYPRTELPGAGVKIIADPPSWEDLKRMPFQALSPGGTYELPLALDKVYPFPEPGAYEVQFATTIPLLIGEPDGAFADYCPIRLRVRSVAKFTVR